MLLLTILVYFYIAPLTHTEWTKFSFFACSFFWLFDNKLSYHTVAIIPADHPLTRCCLKSNFHKSSTLMLVIFQGCSHHPLPLLLSCLWTFGIVAAIPLLSCSCTFDLLQNHSSSNLQTQMGATQLSPLLHIWFGVWTRFKQVQDSVPSHWTKNWTLWEDAEPNSNWTRTQGSDKWFRVRTKVQDWTLATLVCRAYVLHDVVHFAECRDQTRAETWILVQDDSHRKSIVWYDVLCIVLCCFFGCDCLVARDKNQCFAAIVVCDCKDAVKSLRDREICDKIECYNLER